MIQSPSSITVKEGDSAQITCCWSEIKYKVKVTWYINQTRLSDVKREIYEPKTQNCSMLNFTNILKNATGLYVCEVTQDIPVLIQKRGSGTTLSVKDDQLETTTTGELLKDCHNSFHSDHQGPESFWSRLSLTTDQCCWNKTSLEVSSQKQFQHKRAFYRWISFLLEYVEIKTCLFSQQLRLYTLQLEKEVMQHNVI